jgi:V8-like Glu-specific endopeptidase
MKYKLFGICLLLLATTVMAEPRPTKAKLKKYAKIYDFEGIVKLEGCSASLIKFYGQPLEDLAYVLTNAHCIKRKRGLMPSKKVIYNKRSRIKMKAYNDKLREVKLKTNTLVYATMAHTDAALYRVNQTYQQLEDKGVRAFELDSRRPVIGTSMDIVSGFWNRGYRCHIDDLLYKIIEGRYTWFDSIKYSKTGCDIIDGTSGAPIIETGTRVVIGINNTANEKGKKCTMENPCEVDQNGNVLVLHKRSYGQQTYQFYSCLDEDYNIDLSIDTCLLPKPIK